MEAQGTSSSETRLDFAVLPDVPLFRVLGYLSGLQIEKCRGISRVFRERIDMNRKSLPTVQVYSLTIDQKKFDHQLPTSDHNEVGPIVLITIRTKDGEQHKRRKYGAAPLKKALERFDHMLPRMSIKTLHLELEYFDDTTFHELLKKFEDFNIKCQVLLVVAEGQKFQWDDLRPMLLQLEPENFSLEILGENTPFTSSFWQEKCIRDRRELCIGAEYLSFDDQVLLNFPCPILMLGGDTACTFDGIASFLKEWKAGTREVTKLRLPVLSDLNINAFFAMLPWNIEIETVIEHDGFSYSAIPFIMNSLGKKLHLWINECTATKTFWFEMLDDDWNDGLFPSWVPDDNENHARLRLRYESVRKFHDVEILKTWPIKELLS